jgi:hypothetical protein
LDDKFAGSNPVSPAIFGYKWIFMDIVSLNDINLLDVGNVYSLAGSVWAGKGRIFIASFPEAELPEGATLELLKMDYEEWKRFLRQSDIMEVEILKDDGNGLKKTIVRKSQRLIDDQVMWQVFKRDHYACRYCGRDGVKLTVDHIITWEEGGATIAENLLTSCRKCNKERGMTPYEQWINGGYYKRVSNNLDDLTRQLNEDIVKQLEQLRTLKVQNIRSR